MECATGKTNVFIREEYKNWSDTMYDFWMDIMQLCSIPVVKGYGLRARNAIPSGTVVGEYTGKLMPVNDDLPDEFTVFHCPTDIGISGTGVCSSPSHNSLQPFWKLLTVWTLHIHHIQCRP